jgi:lysophospholipase L1-like esterase
MKKLNERTIRLLLIVSVIINALCFGYGIKKIITIFNMHKARTEIAATNQPDTNIYYPGRKEVFEKLPNSENEIILVGNSLTHNFEWHEIFRDVNIINRGISGDITKGVIQRLNEIVESNPIKIFIEIGINDIAQGFPIDSVYANYVTIIQTIKLKSPGTKIYIQSILPSKEEWNNNIVGFNERIKIYSIGNGLTYIDLYSKFVSGQKLDPKYDCGDNIHLSVDGYLLWCNSIKEYIYE